MNIPEVQAATRAAMLWQPLIREGDQFLQCAGMEADADFFKVFPEYRLVEGSAEDFVGKEDILISESLARKLSVDGDNLIGKVINVNESDRTIKGVFADFDGTFFMPYDIITHISGTWAAEQERNFGSIGNYTTWFRVREDADPADVRNKVSALLHKNYDPIWSAEKVNAWKAYRMDEAFFTTGNSNGLTRQGNAQMLRLLTVVVLLLLLSAVFNYVNLSLALTGKRSKEMATRRLLGADKTGILWKYIGESVAFTAVCFAAALLLADLLSPMMNSLVSTGDPDELMLGMGDTSVRLSFMMTPGYILAYIGGILLLGTVCGLLPAIVASRYEPIDVIKGTLRRRNKMVLSKVFIVVQNVLSVFLIALALTMEVQMRHMLTRPLQGQGGAAALCDKGGCGARYPRAHQYDDGHQGGRGASRRYARHPLRFHLFQTAGTGGGGRFRSSAYAFALDEPQCLQRSRGIGYNHRIPPENQHERRSAGVHRRCCDGFPRTPGL